MTISNFLLLTLACRHMHHLAGSNSPALSIQPTLFEAFSEYTVYKAECTVTRNGVIGWSSTQIVLNEPPAGGSCTINPKVGQPVLVCLLVGCLTSQQQASVSQGRICSDNFTCCHTEIEVADQTFYLSRSQYTDTGPTSPSADPITPGAWQGSHWSANV